MAPLSAPSSLEALPPNVLQQLVLLLPDPSALAATSRSLAALLDEDALLLAWWDEHRFGQTRLAAAGEEVYSGDGRHPGYALLHWRRVHSFSMPRLAALLLWQATRGAPVTAQAAASSTAQQLLDAGDSVGSIQALLPHSGHLLLPYAAHAGHTQLLSALLAALAPTLPRVRLEWDKQSAGACLLTTALRAAVRGGHAAALQALLPLLRAKNEQNDAPDLGMQLMQFMIYAGDCSSAACVAVVMGMCQLPVGCEAHVWHGERLHSAAHSGSAAAVAALLSAGLVTAAARQEALKAALRQRHVHLLPLLRPTGVSEEEDGQVALAVCTSLRYGGIDEGDLRLALLPQAMWQLRHRTAFLNVWLGCLRTAISANSVATLQDIWTAPAAPEEDRAALSRALLWALASPSAQPHPDVARWLLDSAVQELRAAGAADTDTLQEARLYALQHGHLELCDALDPSAPPCATLALEEGHPWHMTQRQGLLLHAVHRGDAAAAHSVLQAPGSSKFVAKALCSTAFIKDAEAAEAVVRVLAPAWGDEAVASQSWDVIQCLLLPHGGRLLRALCDIKPQLLAVVAVDTKCGSACVQRACAGGHVELAWWLLCRPTQHPAALSMLLTDSEHVGVRFLASINALLRRAVAVCPKDTGDGGTGGVGGAAGSSRPASSSSSNGVGDGGSGGRNGSGGSRPPAGARQLTADFMTDVLNSGDPDLLHALLAFMDCWGPCQE